MNFKGAALFAPFSQRRQNMELEDLQPHFDDMIAIYRDIATHNYDAFTTAALLTQLYAKIAAMIAIIDA